MKILVAGSVAFNMMIYVDQFPLPQPQTVFSHGFHETLGGTGAGKALNLHKLGIETTLFSLIGEDEAGARARAYLEAEGVTAVYAIDPAGTQRHINVMDAAGRRLSIFIVKGSFEPELDTRQVEALIQRHTVVVLDIVNYCRALIPLVKARKKPLWCDIHDYDGKNPHHQDFIEAADYIFMSSDALPNYRIFMEDLIAAGKRMVVCTHGRNGASALTTDGVWVETPVIDTYVRKDTNGAGDSFFGGFLYGYLRGYPIQRCMWLGTITSGLCITSMELAYPKLRPTLIEQTYRTLNLGGDED